MTPQPQPSGRALTLVHRLTLPGLAALGLVVGAATGTARAADPTVVELPPLIVAESTTSAQWWYTRGEGVEFLSRCGPSLTRHYAEAWLRQMQLVRTLVPARFLARLDVPAVIVLYPKGLKQAVTPEIQRQLQAIQADQFSPGLPRYENGGRVGFAPNMRLNDRDMHAAFVSVDEARFDARTLIVAPGYLHFLLVGRVPALPEWLVEGLDRTYLHADFVKTPITLPPLVWTNRWDSEALARDPDRPRALLPGNELFAPNAAKAGDTGHPRRVEVMHSGAELFVRWAIDAGGPTREALWTFAGRAAEEPVTEEMFEACFGFGFAELRDRLSDYLPRAVKESPRVYAGKPPAAPRVEVRPATPSEIARIRGEWERLAIGQIQATQPQVRELYVEQARRTLQAAFVSGDRDPRLLATLGLCELDAGNPTGAREYLEPAIAGGVIRPRAYFEVARLRWAALRSGRPETEMATAVELAEVLRPLRQAAKQAPPLPEVFALYAEAWVRCDSTLGPEDLAVLETGARLFARHPVVSFYLAVAFARHGLRERALHVITASEDYIRDEAARRRFADLRATLEGKAGGK